MEEDFQRSLPLATTNIAVSCEKYRMLFDKQSPFNNVDDYFELLGESPNPKSQKMALIIEEMKGGIQYQKRAGILHSSNN